MRKTVRRGATTVFATTLLLLVAAPAWAHVTVRSEDPTTGAFAKYIVRVPNERDDAATIAVALEIPAELEVLSYQPKPGWDVEIGDGTVTFSGGEIGPGQFDEFAFVGRNPETPTSLTLPAVQTYEGGEEVRWIGEPDSDAPAPVVEIVESTEKEADHHAEGAEGEETAASEGAEESAASEDEEATGSASGVTEDDEDLTLAADDAEGASSALTWVALGLGVVGVVLAFVALSRSRRP